MRHAFQAWMHSLRAASGPGPLLAGALFWAILASLLSAVIHLAAAGAPWQNAALIPGMAAALLWLAVFVKVALSSAEDLLAFVGGLFLLGLFIELLVRIFLR
ncbi:MAG: hypothetical protein PHF72_08105 [Gammaproteobacteria bacterium]|nr:hypothetical protein [Gammaproteobacteria bacterium]